MKAYSGVGLCWRLTELLEQLLVHSHTFFVQVA